MGFLGDVIDAGKKAVTGSVEGSVQMGMDMFSAKQSANVSKQSAREQMAFQKKMSDTAHQREVKDLLAAGLNPVLSANTGASSPAGAGYDMSDWQAGKSFMSGRQTSTEIQKGTAATSALEAQIEQTQASAKQIKQQTELTEQQTREAKIKADRADEVLKATIESLRGQGAASASQAGVNIATGANKTVENEMLNYQLEALKTIGPQGRAWIKIFSDILGGGNSAADIAGKVGKLGKGRR